jgi:2-keto-3-deoxy-L-rhamnonate aldolase RhmA
MQVRNVARERLEKGEMSLGVGIRTARSVDIAKMMKTADYDWLFIDLEHGPMSIEFATTIAVAPLDDAAIPRIETSGRWTPSPLLNSDRGGAISIPTPDPLANREVALP